MQDLPNKRSIALQVGTPFYITDKPCARGNIHKRQASDGKCLCPQCLNIRSQRGARYRLANADRLTIAGNAWVEKNRDRSRANKTKWRESNREKDRASKEKWLIENREFNLQRRRSRYQVNKAESFAWSAKRRADIANRTPVWFSELDQWVFQECAELMRLRVEATGVDWHVDHLLPLKGLTVSGLHVWQNFDVVPGYLNRRKGNRVVMTNQGSWLFNL